MYPHNRKGALPQALPCQSPPHPLFGRTSAFLFRTLPGYLKAKVFVQSNILMYSIVPVFGERI